MSEAKLTIHIENKRPIELIEFTESFESLGNEYYKFLSENDNFKLSKETKLYVKEVKSGSIITVLSDLAPIAIPFIENSNSIIEFAKFIKTGYDYFLGKTDDKPKDFDIKDCNNFNNIVKVIANDKGSNISFNAECNIDSLTINYNYNSIEANAIQNGIVKEREKLKEPESNSHEKVLFYWDSAKYDEKSKSVDKGFIDSLNPNPLRIVFENQETKSKMLDIENNPFHFAFVVDVEILTIQKNPTAYKIIKLHEYFLK